MKFSFFPLITIVTFSIFILVACGKGKSGGSSTSNDSIRYYLGKSMEAQRDLTSDEITVATKICNSLKSKKENFPKDFINTKFKFNFEEKNCDDSIKSYQLLETQLDVNGDNLTFIYQSAGKSHTFHQLKTNENDPYDRICEMLDQSKTPKILEQKSIDTIRQFKFDSVSDNNVAKAYIYEGKKKYSSSDIYYVTKIEEFYFNVLDTDTLYGLEQKSILKEYCPANSKNPQKKIIKEFKQTSQ